MLYLQEGVHTGLISYSTSAWYIEVLVAGANIGVVLHADVSSWYKNRRKYIQI